MASLISPGLKFYTADDSPYPDTSQSAPVVGWERRTIQFPRADMSGSSGNAYPENIRNQRFKFSGQLGPSDTHDSLHQNGGKYEMSIYKIEFKDKENNDSRPISLFHPWVCKRVERSRGSHKNRGASLEISHTGAKTEPRSFQ